MLYPVLLFLFDFRRLSLSIYLVVGGKCVNYTNYLQSYVISDQLKKWNFAEI